MPLLPLLHEHLLYKDQVCYVFHQCCHVLEGVKQALWLNKTKLTEGRPEKVPSLTGDPRNHTEDQDEPVLNAISQLISGTLLKTSLRERPIAQSLWTA